MAFALARGIASARPGSSLAARSLLPSPFTASPPPAPLNPLTPRAASLSSLSSSALERGLRSIRPAAPGSAAPRPRPGSPVRALQGLFSWMGSQASTGPASYGEKWWSADTIAVVTGSNKGIGFQIARGLAEAGILTVVTSRDPKLGEEATKKLQADGLTNVVYHQLDITDKASVTSFAAWVKETYGGLDILVNNAGFAYKGNTFGAQEADVTIGVNYRGTRAITETLLPMMRPSPDGARIVNVSSQAGLLRILGSGLQKRFTAPDLSLAELDALANEFVEGIAKGTYSSQGWPQSMYGVSKVLESAYTRVLASELAKRPEGDKVYVNACCPGWCATDMSSHMGPRSAAQGADTPLFLALRSASECTNGLFYFERAQRSF